MKLFVTNLVHAYRITYMHLKRAYDMITSMSVMIRLSFNIKSAITINCGNKCIWSVILVVLFDLFLYSIGSASLYLTF